MVDMTATNSTCDILMPGHARGPPDHGMNVPLTGSTLDSLESQRVGRKESASDPHIFESTCMEAPLTKTFVFAGT